MRKKLFFVLIACLSLLAAGCSSDSCGMGEFPGGIHPVLMVNGTFYQWDRLSALGLTVWDEEGVVTGGTYLPEGFQEAEEITSVTKEMPIQDFQIQAGVSITGTVYTNPEAPLVVYACVSTDWLRECYVRFVSEQYQPSLIRLDGRLYWFDAVGDGAVCASELLEKLPERCVSAGTIQNIVWDRIPVNDLEVNDARDTYGKSLWGREVFRDLEDDSVIYIYEEQYWREGSRPAWRACHLWEGEG